MTNTELECEIIHLRKALALAQQQAEVARQNAANVAATGLRSVIVLMQKNEALQARLDAIDIERDAEALCQVIEEQQAALLNDILGETPTPTPSPAEPAPSGWRQREGLL